jgi:DNA-binding transcriptional ArsR family regulator
VEGSIENVRVLTNKTRISILKNLSKRNYTISELSKVLNLTKPTVLHHTKILESAGYVRRVEDDRKWVYYEITSSGESVLRWKKLKIILPVISTIASAIISFTIILLKSMRRKGVPEYPVFGVGYDWLLLISITAFIISLFIVYIIKRGD